MTPVPEEAPPGADEELLDELFEDALAARERGEELALDARFAGRPELEERAAELLRLAREVAVHAPRAARPARIVGGYELEHELGAGSMGTVFLARQTALGGRRVALKVLPPSLGLSPRARTRFLAEARALAKLDHPQVVGVLDVIEQEGIVAFAMDWVPGGSLARVLAAWRAAPERDEMEVVAATLGVERARFTHANAVGWLLAAFARLARALASVHARGLLHRDIKPANLLVRSDGELLLSDFGLVRDSEASLHTRTGAYVGTLAYSPPEQLRGELERVDERSDVYALAVALHETLTLELPFAAPTLSEAQRRKESGLLAPPRRRGVRLPRDLETILARALEPEPERRYASAMALAEDLERLIAFQPIRARAVGPLGRLVKAARRNRRVLAGSLAGGLIALVASAAVGLYAWRLPDEAQARLRAARLELLEPRWIDGFTPLPASHAEDARDIELGSGWSDVIAGVLERYDDALRVDPLGWASSTEAARRERSVVVLAAAIGSGAERTQLVRAIEPSLPLTARVARGWQPSGPGIVLAPEELARAGDLDLDALGLLGYLLRDELLAVQALGRHTLDVEPNLVADVALGELYLFDEQPDLALAHLSRVACSVGSAFLYGEMADCEIRLGHLDPAGVLLDKAGKLPGDYADSSRRVMADLLRARGRLDEALSLYRELYAHHSGPRLTASYADCAAELGDHLLETALRSADVYNHGRNVRIQERFLDAAQAWWGDLDPPRRWSVLRQVLDGDGSALPPMPIALGVQNLFPLLRESCVRHAELPAQYRWDEPAPRRWRPRSSAGPTVVCIAFDLERCGASTAVLAGLPAAVKDGLALLWFSPVREPWRSTVARLVVAVATNARS